MNKNEKRNNQVLITILIAIMSIMNLLAQNKNNSIDPHNGVIKKVKNYYVESIIKDGKVYFFILDDKKAPMSNTEITGTAIIIFTDSKSKKVELTSIERNAFIINDISAHTYTDIQVTFKIKGKSISTIFSKERKLKHFTTDKTKYYHEQSTEHSYK